MTNSTFGLDAIPGLVELNPRELENTDGGLVAVTIGAALCYFGGGVVVGAAIGYGVASFIEWVEA